LGRDFHRLWVAFTVSAFGSAVGLGALPLIAVLALDVSTFQVSMLSALSAIGGLLGLPMGDFIEQRRKRPVMITADLARFVVLGSVPVAAVFDVLTYTQLCVVGVVQAAALIAFSAASGAHLKALVPAEGRPEANSRFEQTNWITLSVGPAIGAEVSDTSSGPPRVASSRSVTRSSTVVPISTVVRRVTGVKPGASKAIS